MPEARKRPCRICRRWFRPDSRVGVRQRACHAPECQTARRQKTQASWRSRNPGYTIAWRIDRRATQVPQPPEPLRLPAPLDQLPWEFAKDQFGVQRADFIGVMGALTRISHRLNPHPRGASVSPKNGGAETVSYTHLRAHETRHDLVCRLLLEKKKK